MERSTGSSTRIRSEAWTFWARFGAGAGTAAPSFGARAGAFVTAPRCARRLRSPWSGGPNCRSRLRWTAAGCGAGDGGDEEVISPAMTATAIEPTAAAGAPHSNVRRSEKVRREGGGVAAISATRSRSSLGAEGVSSRSAVARSGDKARPHFLLELRERAVEAGRAGGRRDTENAGGLLGV